MPRDERKTSRSGRPIRLPEVEPEMAAAFQNALSLLRRAGVSIRSVDIAGMLARLDEATTTVMFYEGARFHQQRYKEHGSKLDDLADLVRDGLQIPCDALRRGEAVHRGVQSQSEGAVQGDACHPGAVPRPDRLR